MQAVLFKKRPELAFLNSNLSIYTYLFKGVTLGRAGLVLLCCLSLPDAICFRTDITCIPLQLTLTG